VDAYGANDLSAWFKEEDHFVTRVLSPGLSDEELGLLNRPADGVTLKDVFLEAFDEIVLAEVVALKNGAASIENITPAEYERLCARLLDEA
ncbi:hypothetical protein ABTD21_19580, partial [Acinetobacter baumannii]